MLGTTLRTSEDAGVTWRFVRRGGEERLLYDDVLGIKAKCSQGRCAVR